MVIERRNKTIGIIIGACIIAAGFYVGIVLARPWNVTFFLLFSFLVSLIGGFISGILTRGPVEDTIRSGFWSGLFGACSILIYFLTIVILDTLAGTVTLATGFALYGGAFIALIVGILAVIGGWISMIAKRALFEDSNANQEHSQE